MSLGHEVVAEVRGRLLRRFDGLPVKWKIGKLVALDRVLGLMTAYQLPVAILQVHREAYRWARYYDEAATFVSQVERDLGTRPWYLDADELLRMHLLGYVFSQLVGRLLRSRYPWGAREATVDLRLVIDTDLRQPETREHFRQTLMEWAKASQLHHDLGTRPSITVGCQTEQEEPLLLLPDYIVGTYHHADPRTRIVEPVVTLEEASVAVSRLRQGLGRVLYEHPEDFDEPYPLAHNDGRIVPRYRLDRGE